MYMRKSRADESGDDSGENGYVQQLSNVGAGKDPGRNSVT